jgi:hypothetical protein
MLGQRPALARWQPAREALACIAFTVPRTLTLMGWLWAGETASLSKAIAWAFWDTWNLAHFKVSPRCRS